MPQRPVKTFSEDSSVPMACPKCQAPMSVVTAEEIAVDRCTACAGLWLDALELDKLMDSRRTAKQVDVGPEADRQKLPQEKRYRCPRDRSDLIVLTDLGQRHIKYESCTVCGGIFLDAGELKDLDELTLREWLRSFVP
ncbi:MAG: zf-TFIIB domain-containing protein [Pyrinomonadaceae bacterium]|nr:zf-TFIIB domain-containing protein [Phycisphaerales bacterium]